MTISRKIGFLTGMAAAELYRFAKISAGPVVAIQTSRVAKKAASKLSKVAAEHAIDSSDAAIVTKNIFDCLEYID